MTSAKKIRLFLTVGIFLTVGLLIVHLFWRGVSIDGRIFMAELPLNAQAYKKGLGGRERICSRCAMLFNFSHKSRYAFWMKGMKFNLDILWIEAGKIVYIEKNIPADSSETFKPDAVADGVLEIRAGLSEKYGFKVGDRVKIY